MRIGSMRRWGRWLAVMLPARVWGISMCVCVCVREREREREGEGERQRQRDRDCWP